MEWAEIEQKPKSWHELAEGSTVLTWHKRCQLHWAKRWNITQENGVAQKDTARSKKRRSNKLSSEHYNVLQVTQFLQCKKKRHILQHT